MNIYIYICMCRGQVDLIAITAHIEDGQTTIKKLNYIASYGIILNYSGQRMFMVARSNPTI